VPVGFCAWIIFPEYALDRVVVGIQRAAKRPSTMAVHGRFQYARKRLTLEQFARLKIDIECGIAFAAAKVLEVGREDAAIHAGAECAAFEAVATQRARVEAGAAGVGLEDAGDDPGGNGYAADMGQGGCSGRPDSVPGRRSAGRLPNDLS
jgi:hypothetical protein